MRLQGPALASLLISLLASGNAVADFDAKNLSGLVLSAGQAHSREDDSGEGSALFLDANYSRVFTNFGGSFKAFDESKVLNAYAGIGFTGLLQFQFGFGTDGPVRRIRSDFNITRAYDVLTGTRRNRYNQSLGTRLTFTFAQESYAHDKHLDNFHAGIGLLY